jgi:uncharacterized protein (TIGR03032 family)
MKRQPEQTPDALWAQHHAEWRDPAQIVSQWAAADAVNPQLLRSTVHGAWWETLERLALTLLVTREYEHLVLGLTVTAGKPQISYLPLPHPSGLAVDARRGLVHIAATRNPNQIFTFAPLSGSLARADARVADTGRPLLPRRSTFLPGCLYLHDLAMIDGELHANAVGQNAVVRISADGTAAPVWWPRSIERADGPAFERNYLQLNSIAAGSSPQTSYYSASTAQIGGRRPGQRHFAVDRRGVIFDGATREVLVGGLTRPHSARLANGRLLVNDSGYGRLVAVDRGRLEPLLQLPGWTRGLCVAGDIAFVGTSRVIPRFRQYAPGLAVDDSRCGLHAVDLRSGTVLGSLYWPNGNQIFAIEAVPAAWTTGFALTAGRARQPRRERDLYYAYQTAAEGFGAGVKEVE